MDFVNLVDPQPTKPPSQFAKANFVNYFGPLSGATVNFFRDSLAVSTWLALGALLQSGLYGLFGRVSFIPAVVLIVYRVSSAFLMAVGVKHNPYMDGIIANKFCAQFPDQKTGKFGNKPSNREVVVFLIGTRVNHPMGLFAPGYNKVGEYFGKMSKQLNKYAEKYGFLGQSSWIAAGERATNQEYMSVIYFDSVKSLHDYAHGPLHREAWNWWNKHIKLHPHIGIWHEIFAAPKGNWEAIYVNCAPLGLSATTIRAPAPGKGEGGEKEMVWYTPIVDARKGLLKTSAGRMSRSEGNEHEKYDDDPYENYA